MKIISFTIESPSYKTKLNVNLEEKRKQIIIDRRIIRQRTMLQMKEEDKTTGEKKAKAVLRMTFIVIEPYLRKQEKLQIKQFIFLIISKGIRKRRTKQRSNSSERKK